MLTPPDDVKIYEWPTSTVWMKDGILYSVSKKGTRSLEEARGVKKAFQELSDEPVLAIIDVSNMPEMSKEIREYAAEELPKMIKAAALLSDSALGKMVANLFFTLKTQPYPTKFFNDVDKAREWLEQYK